MSQNCYASGADPLRAASCDSVKPVALGKKLRDHSFSSNVQGKRGYWRRYGRVLPKLALLVRCALARPRISFDDVHILASLEWLLRAQRIWGNKGYAHSYSLVHGWGPPYPETTGYLIPTLHRTYLRYGIPELLESVTTATGWLYAIQRADGSFPDLDGNAQVFDTAQVMIGLNYVAEHLRDSRRDIAIRAAAEWLLGVQEPNGSFVRHAYHNRCHSYYSRVGAALIRTGRILGSIEFEEAGRRNLDWTLSQQLSNGCFSHMSFDERPPFLHTMTYVMEGLLDGYEMTSHQPYFDAVLRFADRLLAISAQRDLMLRSQYQEDLSFSNPEKCLTGLAQWAGVSLRMFMLTGNALFREEALKCMYYVKSRQIFVQHEDVYGGLPGSVPMGGSYMRYSLPNWGLKFFIDALLLKQTL